MKKKILYQSFLIFLIMIIGIFSSIPVVNAVGKATLSCSGNVKVGEKFTVTLNMPSDAFAIEATVTVKFSDGTTVSDRIGYIGGLSSNSLTFTATKAGTATITATNIIISDAEANETRGDSISTTINIADNTPAPTTPTTPTTPTGPSNSGSNNSGSTSSNQVTFTDVNETVYTTDRVNLRKSYSTSSEKITTLAKDTKLTRTGIASNGWSRVNYNGQTAYVSSQYLTKNSSSTPSETTTPTENEVKFTDVKDTMYANQNCNLRKSWSTDSDRVGYLIKGEEVQRTGTSTNGWSRIEYKGQIVYVMTRLLTKDKPEDSNENLVDDETIIDENEITEGEKTELEILQEEIGVLPEVGNNIATRIYFVITIITLSGSFIGLYYMKKDVR